MFYFQRYNVYIFVFVFVLLCRGILHNNPLKNQDVYFLSIPSSLTSTKKTRHILKTCFLEPKRGLEFGHIFSIMNWSFVHGVSLPCQDTCNPKME